MRRLYRFSNILGEETTAIAGQTELSREQLYRSFSEKEDPRLMTALAVRKALTVQLNTKGSAMQR